MGETPRGDGQFRVLIAGAGVAGLEALLALHRSVGGRTAIDLLAPDEEYVYRQLAVAEPFSAGEATRLELGPLVAAAGGRHLRGRLERVLPEARLAVAADGSEHRYDALLIAVGTRQLDALPGAITYRGFTTNAEIRRAVLDVDMGAAGALGFAVPVSVRWALPLYELALLSAWHLNEIGDRGVEIHFVTHETEPLGIFGPRASALVRELLAEAGIHLHTQAAPAAVADGQIKLMGGGAIRSDRVVALPRLEVPEIPGIPQGPGGFIDTDREMRVTGTEGIYAAGDSTWYPINQGGLAAQQADAAASAIAAQLDPSRDPAPFVPVLRGALLTGQGPRYLRATVADWEGTSAAGSAPLWWPPGKVAGRYLAPFLAARAFESSQPPPPLADLRTPLDEEDERHAEEHAEAIAMCLAAADSDARWEEWASALRWLDAAEQLAITLPADYALKREQWRGAARAARVP